MAELLLPENKFPRFDRPFAGFEGLLVELLCCVRVAAFGKLAGRLLQQYNRFFQAAGRFSERLLNGFGYVGQQRTGRVGVAGMATVPDQLAFFDADQCTAAFGAGQGSQFT